MDGPELLGVLALGLLLGAACAIQPSGPGPGPTATPASATPTTAPQTRTFTIDPGTASNLQREVDEGRQPWRLDPAQVAVATLEAQGIDPSQVQFRRGEANLDPATRWPRTVVQAILPTDSWEVELVQPARQGDGGIWMALALRPSPRPSP